MGRAGLRACAIALAALGLAAPAAAQRALAVERFDADIHVRPDGAVEVAESIRVRFTGAWNGFYRTIPIQYRTPHGFNYTLRLDVREVTDGRDRPLRYESSRERHYRQLKIWVPDAVNATRTVVIRYRVRNALRFFAQHDELYWNVTGDEWEAPIESASARVYLPAGVEGLRTAAFTGGYGSREGAVDVDEDEEAAVVTVRTRRRLNFREGLTVVAGWNPGPVHRPTAAERAGGFLLSNVLLLVPLFVFPVMWSIWHRHGRDPRRRSIAPRYEPPDGLTPGEVGTLVDHSPDMRDISATLVDLAVRGFLLIEETEQRTLLGLMSSTDYVFTLRRDRSAWAGLRTHERRLLSALFSRSGRPVAAEAAAVAAADGAAAESVALSDLQNRFYQDLPGIRNALYDRLVREGHYLRRPDRVKTAWCVGGAFAGFLVVFAGIAASLSLGIEPGTAVASGILTAAIICGFGWFMPARTEEGRRALEQVLGFEEFLRRVERDRFERTIESPEMFERYLPYAMALGVERNWARAFDGISRQPPEWYRGGDPIGFRPSGFVGDLARLSTRAAAVMASAPRSSGGSGFGGGGSSGGGFGGGGGRGF